MAVLTEATKTPVPQTGRLPEGKIFRKIEPYLYLLPAFFFLILFTYYPFVKNTVLSFFSVNRYRDVNSFVGFANYLRVLGDEKFIQAVGNTLLYGAATVPVSIFFGFALALLARRRTKRSVVYEALYALSMAVSASVVAMIFQLALNPSMGIVNKVFALDISWLTNPRTALFSLIFIQIWANIGYNFIFLLSALRGMSEEVLEGAKLDGASGFKLLGRVIIPMISPTLLFLLVKDIAYAMTTCSFTLILTYPVFHSGGPQGTTEMIMSYIYGKGIRGTNYNAAFAATMAGFVLSAVMMAFSLALEKKKVHYS
ncbi:MAG: sugar ABC transporter permease [Treponema sp.]|jgi:ABC-type sugar transport system permease subunit|nr:sugar ABC transporter permease [Treponema sp.]